MLLELIFRDKFYLISILQNVLRWKWYTRLSVNFSKRFDDYGADKILCTSMKVLQ